MTPIAYPNDALDIGLVGKPAAWQRRLLLRPQRAGEYSVLVWPTHALELRMVQRVDLLFRDGQGAPQPVLFTVRQPLRVFRDWSWRLVRWPNRLDPDASPDTGIESRRARGAPPLEAKRRPPTSALLFEEHPVMEGRFSLEDDWGDTPHRIVLWSCNQPYATDDAGGATLNPETPAVLDWVERRINEFAPHVVWGLGDTAYADGTAATNFVDQVYGEVDLAGRSELRDELRSAYRRMYRLHWSFAPLQRLMRSIPHLTVWDDHEIRDGWGSEDEDFAGGNPLVFEAAREVADEYILNNGPRVRLPSSGEHPDAHQGYVAGSVAAFIFDGRSSRRYSDPGGRIISDEQFADFEAFCARIARDRRVEFLVMGTAVPFINLKDFVEELGSQAPKALTDLMAGIRDDIRDSWHSKGNRDGLKRLIGILRKLHWRRPDIDMVNVSGDIHVANAFSFQPFGFTKCLYQFTSSALTNREHPPEAVAALVDLGSATFTEVLGLVTRIWDSLGDPNVMMLEPRGQALRVTLRVYDLDVPAAERDRPSSAKDLVFDVGTETFGLRRMLAG
ncbi:MAG: alkaline phosphatase D family protein [Burkholderiales bacterium]